MFCFEIGECLRKRADCSPLSQPVLRVCKQIRYEGMKTFYVENRFSVIVVEWSSKPPKKWLERVLPLNRNCHKLPCPSTLDMEGNRNWQNLLEWLQWSHSTPSIGLPPPTQAPRIRIVRDDEFKTICLMFANVATLGDLGKDWTFVASILKQHHRVLETFHSSWRMR